MSDAPGTTATGSPRRHEDHLPREPSRGTELPRSARPGSAGESIYLLVFNEPDAPADRYGIGWTLTAWRDSGRQWSVQLAARGAGAGATVRTAQAVAVRVLAEHGVPVFGWNDGGGGGPLTFRARFTTGERAELTDGAVSPTAGPSSASYPTSLARSRVERTRRWAVSPRGSRSATGRTVGGSRSRSGRGC